MTTIGFSTVFAHVRVRTSSMTLFVTFQKVFEREDFVALVTLKMMLLFSVALKNMGCQVSLAMRHKVTIVTFEFLDFILSAIFIVVV